MTKIRSRTRRRAIKILASAGGATLLVSSPVGARATARTWRGWALGGAVTIQLFGIDKRRSGIVLARCVKQIRRLEAILSLYQPDSALSTLNRRGSLDGPPQDLVQVLNEARVYSELTQGAFDVTVQPLWKLYARHFQRPGADTKGPNRLAVQAALDLVDFRGISVLSNRISLGRPGMAITLNGIAQGYITDRVSELLRAQGLSNVLVDLGEIRALGRHPSGRAWQIAVPGSGESVQPRDPVPLDNSALATSGGYGTRFEGSKMHHLFDPSSGRCADRYQDMTVLAPTATMADALSTGFSSLDTTTIGSVVRKLKSVSALAGLPNGRVHSWPAIA